MDPRDNIYNPYHPYYRMGNGIRKDTQLHPAMPYSDAREDTSVVQSRILELRKEKSRDAARSRRGKENHEFFELAKMLPLPPAITSQLDKASIIRLTISYLKLREFALNGIPSWVFPSFGHLHTNSALKSKICNAFDSQQGQHILQSLDGFMFLLGQDGRFLYISETVSIYLGLSQTEVIGSSIFDYCHQADHAELALNLGLTSTNLGGSSTGKKSNAKQFNSSFGSNSSPLPPSSVCSNGSADSVDPSSFAHYNSPSNSYYTNANQLNLINSGDRLERQFCIRIKSALSKRGCQHFKSNGYRVVQIIAQLRPQLITPITTTPSDQRTSLLESNSEATQNGRNSNLKCIGLVAVAICLPAPSVNDLRLESDTFVTRLGLDFRIVHCEPKVSELFDYNADELVNRNLYSLVHVQDMACLRKAHVELIHKGQTITKYYRIINKNGGYTWIQSCATLISNSLQSSTPPVPSSDTPSPSLNANSPNSTNGNSNNGSTSGKNSSTVTNLNLSSSSNNLSSSNEEQFEQSIICINYVISRLESENLILDTSQLPDNQNKLKQLRSLTNNNSKLQLTHSPPSPPIQPPTKKISNSSTKLRQQSHQSNSKSNLTSPAGNGSVAIVNNNTTNTPNSLSTTTSVNNTTNLCGSIKQSPNSSPCQSPLANSLHHNQLLPIHHHQLNNHLNHHLNHSSTTTTNSDEDVCNNENNHNTMNSVDLLIGSHQTSAVELKRRRYTASASPVRPWKNSPSPISNQTVLSANNLNSSINNETANMTNALLSTQHHLLLGTATSNSNQIHNGQLHSLTPQTQLNPLLNSSLTCSSPESVCSSSSLNGSSSMINNNSNLLKHISVIRETPSILKSQLVPNYHQQNYTNQTVNNHLHHSNQHTNHLMANNLVHHQLSNELNGHQNANNLINHHNSPVQLDHLGQLNQHLAGITTNNMAQHLAQQQQQQQNTSAISPNSLMPVVATAQSTYHQQITNANHSLHNQSTSQALNANVDQHTLMHQALTHHHPLTANHHLTHANHYTNHLHTGHHPSLVDSYSPYAAAAAALHHWSSYN